MMENCELTENGKACGKHAELIVRGEKHGDFYAVVRRACTLGHAERLAGEVREQGCVLIVVELPRRLPSHLLTDAELQEKRRRHNDERNVEAMRGSTHRSAATRRSFDRE